ncbi:MAG: Endonuclease [uncultured Gemmatimonadetes bacterium]|uniref:Endonuclease n=1 Tax=uncultured Gemmatimonadota bacterium TaxID=203437 RepID=A0A6J4L751_9BACT|nr:MAG: Endonuclease [uncultured Gemmatimonadota bacterium]
MTILNQNYKAVRTAAQIQVQLKLNAGTTSLDSSDIRNAVLQMIAVFQCGDVDADAVVADLEASFQTVIGKERTLFGDQEGYEPWLKSKKAGIDWRFWSRYEQYLLQEVGLAPATLDRLDESTDRVVDLLTDPTRPGSWDRRGLVVGHVQSGKTGHYIGVISKAADAGYKLIVVLAGFHNSLRSQTQIRIEEGFLGYDRSVPQGMPTRVGVGIINDSPKANTITTRADNGDFRRPVAESFSIAPGGPPLVFVIKKNGGVLKNLLKWVRWAANAQDEQGRPYVRDVPLLVIDDEADQGSVNTKKGDIDTVTGTPDPDFDPAVLNGRIRELLHLFEQSAYIGYTATPFANIFIHEEAKTEDEGEDLFPRSFIVALPTPSNYVGPGRVFGYEPDEGPPVPGLPIVRLVKDHAATLDLDERQGWIPPKHTQNHVPQVEGEETLPESLTEAIRAFVLVCASRLARQQGSAHNSMLVHVTRFTEVQRQVTAQVKAELRQVQQRLRRGDGDSPYQIRKELQKLWESDFIPTTEQIVAQDPTQDLPIHTWDVIEPFLEQAAQSISVREINGKAGEVLDYVKHQNTGLNVIAIGGDKLSRGLTLEGLSVSYFLRASRMYDTLMQMGRWFGYRPGYLDLCRLYTTPDMTEWFSHIARASEELREDFDRMALSGGTPLDFGHRVQSHPMMMVTSQVKMRHGTTINVSYQGDISETINFWRTRPKLERNWKAAELLISTVESARKLPVLLGDPPPVSGIGAWRWDDVSADAVLEFLTAYQEHGASKKVKTKLLADYIRAELKHDRLVRWTVMIASGNSPEPPRELGSARFRLVERSWHLTMTSESSALTEKQQLIASGQYRIRRLVSPADETSDLSDREWEHALQLSKAVWAKDPEKRVEPDRPAGRDIRRVRTPDRGLLMLYPLDPTDRDKITGTDKVETGAQDIPVLGFAISFPYVDPDKASKVQYVVGNVYYKQEFGQYEGDDEVEP